MPVFSALDITMHIGVWHLFVLVERRATTQRFSKSWFELIALGVCAYSANFANDCCMEKTVNALDQV